MGEAVFRLTIVAILLGSTFVNSHAQVLTKKTGNDWNSASVAFRTGYINGYTDAAASAGANVLAQMKYFTELTKKDREILAGGEKVWDFGNTTDGQILRGMQEFYADYRNESIEWDRAISYVRDTIHGEPKEYLERELEFDRKAASVSGAQ